MGPTDIIMESINIKERKNKEYGTRRAVTNTENLKQVVTLRVEN